MNIIDDFIPENSEFFNASVNARTEDAFIVVIGSPKQPLIEIQDLKDCECLSVQRHDSLYYIYSICMYTCTYVYTIYSTCKSVNIIVHIVFVAASTQCECRFNIAIYQLLLRLCCSSQST